MASQSLLRRALLHAEFGENRVGVGKGQCAKGGDGKALCCTPAAEAPARGEQRSRSSMRIEGGTTTKGTLLGVRT